MLFNEKEMLELCKRYDIEVMNNDDKDYYKDTEFSMSDIMKEPYVHTAVEKCIVSQSIEIPIIIEDDFDNEKDFTCQVIKEKYYDDLVSVVDSNTVIYKAA